MTRRKASWTKFLTGVVFILAVGGFHASPLADLVLTYMDKSTMDIYAY